MEVNKDRSAVVCVYMYTRKRERERDTVREKHRKTHRDIDARDNESAIQSKQISKRQSRATHEEHGTKNTKHDTRLGAGHSPP